MQANEIVTIDTGSVDRFGNIADKFGRRFLTIWAGQVIAQLGSGMTLFGLNVWLATKTGNYASFASMVIFATVPGLIVTPWAGSIADRFDRRRILALVALAGMAIGLVIGLLDFLGHLQVWYLYLASACGSLLAATAGPSTVALETSIVHQDMRGKASGMSAFAAALAGIVAPLLAGMLVPLIGLPGIILINTLAATISLATLYAVSLPILDISADARTDSILNMRRALNDFLAAVDYLRARPALGMVYLYLVMNLFLTSMVEILITPMILTQKSPAALSAIMAVGAMASLIGGIAMAVWGGPRKWRPEVLMLNMVEGIAILCAGVRNSTTLWCMCIFAVMFSSTLFTGIMESTICRKVSLEYQGRIFSLEQFLGMAIVPLGAALGPYLVQYLFEPALMPHGVLADSVGTWLGTGAGRGAGFFFVLIGIAVICLLMAGLMNRRLRRLEIDVPDV